MNAVKLRHLFQAKEVFYKAL